MKLSVFIIGIYFLIIAVLPCHCDTQVADTFGKNTEQVSKMNAEHHNSIYELCAPFCSCSIHHNPTITTNYEIILPPISSNVKYIVTYTDKEIISVPSTFWRPPQA